LARYLERSLDGPERGAVEAHLLECADCRAVLVDASADLEEGNWEGGSPGLWPTVVPFQRRKPVAAVGGALAAAAVVVLGIWLAPLIRPGDEPTVAELPPPDAQERQASPALPPPGSAAPGVVAREALRRPLLVARLSDAETAAVRNALDTSTLEIPAFVRSLQGRTDILRSSRDPSLPQLRDPIGTRVSSVRPTFAWSAVDGAAYEVTVFDASGETVASSGWIAGTTWMPAEGLERGRIYSWQLGAKSATGIVRVPTLADPQARFEVVNEEEAARVAMLRAQSGDAPVVLGVLLTRAGLLAEAETAFAEAATSPDAEVARRLLASLQAARTGATSQ
jgi:hypothetical protein